MSQTLGDHKRHEHILRAFCQRCPHNVVLNLDHLITRYGADTSTSAITKRLLCLCGRRDAIIHVTPDYSKAMGLANKR